MKINTTPRLARSDAPLERLLKDIAVQLNALSEGRLSACYAAHAAPPASGAWALGDFVRNSAPTEQGVSPNKYVIHGWQCVSGGTPGAWVECRFLTGN
jgi:hypothetical protein